LLENKRYRIAKGQSKTDNPEKLAMIRDFKGMIFWIFLEYPTQYMDFLGQTVPLTRTRWGL
jgi:hypothetical protein